ncbi:MAG: hypothetical protein IT202_03235 [Fimbriimonadaceae bacterium]|nr:hypothetical protein [Fimbriimonadaceae bacterium]
MKRSHRENPADLPPTPPGGRRGQLQGQTHAAGGAEGGFQLPIGCGGWWTYEGFVSMQTWKHRYDEWVGKKC